MSLQCVAATKEGQKKKDNSRLGGRGWDVLLLKERRNETRGFAHRMQHDVEKWKKKKERLVFAEWSRGRMLGRIPCSSSGCSQQQGPGRIYHFMVLQPLDRPLGASSLEICHFRIIVILMLLCPRSEFVPPLHFRFRFLPPTKRWSLKLV